MHPLLNVKLGKMRNNSSHKLIIPTTAIMLSSVMLCSCGTSQKGMEKASEKVEQADSVKEFVPLHPPVVIPHSWKEAK